MLSNLLACCLMSLCRHFFLTSFKSFSMRKMLSTFMLNCMHPQTICSILASLSHDCLPHRKT